MTPTDVAAALYLFGLLCVTLLVLSGAAAFLESSPERQAWADRWVRRLLG